MRRRYPRVNPLLRNEFKKEQPIVEIREVTQDEKKFKAFATLGKARADEEEAAESQEGIKSDRKKAKKNSNLT